MARHAALAVASEEYRTWVNVRPLHCSPGPRDSLVHVGAAVGAGVGAVGWAVGLRVVGAVVGLWLVGAVEGAVVGATVGL